MPFSIPLPLFRYLLKFSARIQHVAEPASGIVEKIGEFDFSPEESNVILRIERVRDSLGGRTERIAVRDFGAGEKGMRTMFRSSANKAGRSISSIYRTSSVPSHWGLFLFFLVRQVKPRSVVELGTNLGVSAMYIQAALDMNGNKSSFSSIEGDPTLADIARESVGRISSSRFEVVNGRFQDVLPAVLQKLTPIQLVFIDGHHEEAAMLRYYHSILPFLDRNSVVVFDDLYPWNIGLRRAWSKIRHDEPAAVAVDFAKFGLLFHDGTRKNLA